MPRGGSRQGAGRKSGFSKYGSSTKPMRVPQNMISKVVEFIENGGENLEDQTYKLPLFSNKVSSGFPSPADDYVEAEIDLNRHLIKHPTATFFVRVTGDSMIDAGIHADDILIVDRSLAVRSGSVVIAAVDNYLTVKRFSQKNGKTFLLPENKKYQPIEIKEGMEMVIWGVVTNVIHSL